MKQITVKKEVLLNLGNFSNIKIVAELTTDGKWDEAWKELNQQVEQQELYERGLRLPHPSPTYEGKREDVKNLPF